MAKFLQFTDKQKKDIVNILSNPIRKEYVIPINVLKSGDIFRLPNDMNTLYIYDGESDINDGGQYYIKFLDNIQSVNNIDFNRFLSNKSWEVTLAPYNMKVEFIARVDAININLVVERSDKILKYIKNNKGCKSNMLLQETCPMDIFTFINDKYNIPYASDVHSNVIPNAIYGYLLEELWGNCTKLKVYTFNGLMEIKKFTEYDNF